MFDLKPRIFSLLVCSTVEKDQVTGGWRINPLSHLAAHALPVPLNLILFAGVMAPPGDYQLAFRIFHSQEQQSLTLTAPVSVSTVPGHNVECLAQVSVTFATAGLYVVEAALADYHVAQTPLRITTVADTPLTGDG
jgi:hypothetical protein